MTYAGVALPGGCRRTRPAAVAELTVSVPRGVVAGFIGPNGAGKTTAMAMLLGLVRPTAAAGRCWGADRAPGAVPRHVCDWLLIIDGGRLVYAGEREGFSGRGGTEIVLGPLDPAVLPLADLVAAHGHDAGREGTQLVLASPGADAPGLSARLNGAAASAGIALAEVHVRRPTLESSYLRLLEGDSR